MLSHAAIRKLPYFNVVNTCYRHCIQCIGTYQSYRVKDKHDPFLKRLLISSRLPRKKLEEYRTYYDVMAWYDFHITSPLWGESIVYWCISRKEFAISKMTNRNTTIRHATYGFCNNYSNCYNYKGIWCQHDTSENQSVNGVTVHFSENCWDFSIHPLDPDMTDIWLALICLCFVADSGSLGAVSIRKTVLPGMAIPMLKIRRPSGRLIFNMEIAIHR